jgi:O-antigen ligase
MFSMERNWLYGILALGLGASAAVLLIGLPLQYYLLLCGAVAFFLIVYRRIEWGVGLLVASMFFEQPILPVATELSLTRILSLPILFVCFLKIILERKHLAFQRHKDMAVILFFLWSLASLSRAVDVDAAISGLLTLVQLIVMYFVLKAVISNEVEFKRVLRATVVVAFTLAVWTIGSQLMQPGSLLYSTTLSLSERISGTSDDPNKFAMNLVFVLPLSIYLFTSQRNWYIAAVAIFAVLTLATFSRGGYVALALVLILSLVQLRRAPNVKLGYILLMLVTFGVSFAALNRGNRVLDRIQSLEHYQQGSIRTRYELAEVAVDMGINNPVFGVGLNNFVPNSQYYGNQQHYERAAHNGYLEVFATLGLPGFILLAVIICLSFQDIAKFLGRVRHPDDRLMAIFLKIAFIGYLAAAMFLSLMTQKIFWTMIAFSSLLYKFYEKSYENHKPKMLKKKSQPQLREGSLGGRKWELVDSPSAWSIN